MKAIMSRLFEALLFIAGVLIALWLFPLWLVLASIALFFVSGIAAYIAHNKDKK